MKNIIHWICFLFFIQVWFNFVCLDVTRPTSFRKAHPQTGKNGEENVVTYDEIAQKLMRSEKEKLVTDHDSKFIIYRHSIPFELEKNQVHSLQDIKTMVIKHFDDPSIERFFSMEGREIQDWDHVENEMIVLDHQERFMWPGRYIGYKTSIEAHDQIIEVETLSIHPRVFRLGNLISQEECQEIIQAAQGKMFESTVGTYEAKSKTNERNSQTGWLNPGDYPVIDRLSERVSNLTAIPRDVFEPAQIIHYEKNQHYYTHYDWFDKQSNAYYAGGGNRYITVLYYLTNVEKGGETAFPMTNQDFREKKIRASNTEICSPSFECLKVKPISGDAVMFYNLLENGTFTGDPDLLTLHSGCDVLEGDKWASNLWIRNKRVNGKLYTDQY